MYKNVVYNRLLNSIHDTGDNSLIVSHIWSTFKTFHRPCDWHLISQSCSLSSRVPQFCRKFQWITMSLTRRLRLWQWGSENNRILLGVLAPDAHLSKSIPKRSKRCQSCWTVQLGLSPVVSLGAAVTNEVAVGVCLLLHCAHKIMYMYRGPRGVAAPPAPVNSWLVVV